MWDAPFMKYEFFHFAILVSINLFVMLCVSICINVDEGASYLPLFCYRPVSLAVLTLVLFSSLLRWYCDRICEHELFELDPLSKPLSSNLPISESSNYIFCDVIWNFILGSQFLFLKWSWFKNHWFSAVCFILITILDSTKNT